MASSSSNNSVASSAHPLKPKDEQEIKSEVTAAEELIPKIKQPSGFRPEEKEKFQRYDAELQSYLMSEYFSDKNIYGGNIFDTKMTNDGGTVKASRLSPLASFADPAKFWELMQREDAEAETDQIKKSSN